MIGNNNMYVEKKNEYLHTIPHAYVGYMRSAIKYLR